MKKKVEELTSEEYEKLIDRKRRIVINNYKAYIKKQGSARTPNQYMLSTLVRKTRLVDADLENEEITRGVFSEET